MCNKYDDDEIHVRDATAEDMVHVADMIQELADFEKMPDGPKLSVAELQRDGFQAVPPAFLCKVAELHQPVPGQPAVVGFTIYFPTYSTWEGRALLMEDLYVRESQRKRGIGARLFNAVAQEAVRRNCTRVDFHVLEWNPARGFYDTAGADNLTQKEQWMLYRLQGHALKTCANK